jgi:hypothetical protein
MGSQISDFVYEALSRGVSREDIRQGLMKGGWTTKEINAALDAFVDSDLPLPVPRKRVSGSAKEAFIFLMLFSALYTTVFGLGVILFDLINLYLADPGESDFRWIISLRSGMATVIVAFPIFLFMGRIVRGEALRNPGQRISPIRRWLTYLTMFVASTALVSDLISLIVRFLSGDLTLRFVLKVVVVAILAGIVLSHYLRELRRDETTPSTEYRQTGTARFLRAGLTLAVLIILGFGFWTAGSPNKARIYALDNQRISDLADISVKVQQYYMNKGVLPESLVECDVNPDTYIRQKTDRITGQPYRYRVIDETHFEVGATFDSPSQPEISNAPIVSSPGHVLENPGFWQHGSGSTTFTIDATKRMFQITENSYGVK